MGSKILIVDDHEIVRKGIRTLIEEVGHKDWEVCGEAASGSEALAAVKTLKPDLIILDIAMPSMNGLDAAAQIRRDGGGCRVLLFTMYDSKWLSGEARRVGAHGFVLKSQAARHLIQAIERLLAGGTFYGGPEPEGEPEKGPAGPGMAFCNALGLCVIQ